MTNFCKYCLEYSSENDPLIHPCGCVDGVHSECLYEWLRLRHEDNKFRCEICHVDYIGLHEDDLNPENGLFDECCSCELFEAGVYIAGSIFGLGGSIISIQPGYSHNADAQFAFGMFVGLFAALYSMGIIYTWRRYYKEYVNRIDDVD
jgi:hypothetical protein